MKWLKISYNGKQSRASRHVKWLKITIINTNFSVHISNRPNRINSHHPARTVRADEHLNDGRCSCCQTALHRCTDGAAAETLRGRHHSHSGTGTEARRGAALGGRSVRMRRCFDPVASDFPAVQGRFFVAGNRGGWTFNGYSFNSISQCGFFKRNRPTDTQQERQPLNRNNGYHGDEHL